LLLRLFLVPVEGALEAELLADLDLWVAGTALVAGLLAEAAPEVDKPVAQAAGNNLVAGAAEAAPGR